MDIKVGDIMWFRDDIKQYKYKIVCIDTNNVLDQIQWEYVTSEGHMMRLWALNVNYLLQSVNEGRLIINRGEYFQIGRAHV